MTHPRFRLLVLAALLLLPITTFAAGDGTVTLDFSSSGPLGALFGRVMSVAKSYLLLALLVALAIETWGKGPGDQRRYGHVAWRTLVVITLLAGYGPIFGTTLNYTSRIAARLTPPGFSLTNYDAQAQKLRDAMRPPTAEEKAAAAAREASGGSLNPLNWRMPTSEDVYDVLVKFAILVASSIMFVFDRIAHILTGFLYLVGPLALVASIPLVSGTGTKWFKAFMTIACWPIFSGLLLSLVVASGSQGATASGTGYLMSLVTAGVLAVVAFTAPAISAMVIGGAGSNLASAGLGAATSAAQSGYRAVTNSAAVGKAAQQLLQKKDPSDEREGPSQGRSARRDSGVASNAP